MSGEIWGAAVVVAGSAIAVGVITVNEFRRRRSEHIDEERYRAYTRGRPQPVPMLGAGDARGTTFRSPREAKPLMPPVISGINERRAVRSEDWATMADRAAADDDDDGIASLVLGALVVEEIIADAEIGDVATVDDDDEITPGGGSFGGGGADEEF